MKSNEMVPIKPCKHMEALVSSLSDGSLHGAARWYTMWHLRVCSQCRAALEGFKTLRSRLKSFQDAHSEPRIGNQETILKRMDEVDKQFKAEQGVDPEIKCDSVG